MFNLAAATTMAQQGEIGENIYTMFGRRLKFKMHSEEPGHRIKGAWKQQQKSKTMYKQHEYKHHQMENQIHAIKWILAFWALVCLKILVYNVILLMYLCVCVFSHWLAAFSLVFFWETWFNIRFAWQLLRPLRNQQCQYVRCRWRWWWWWCHSRLEVAF